MARGRCRASRSGATNWRGWWTTRSWPTAVRGIVAAGHVRLVETLAERIAEACLADRRVHLARVRVEKLDIFADATSAGVEIERRQSDLSTP